MTESKTQARRILVVDDHPIVRQGLSQLIDHESDLAVCGEAETAADALGQLDGAKADMCIVDISLRGTNGIELIKQIKAESPSLPVLVLSMHDENLYAERALRAGAKGYIMKQEAPENVLVAIRKVLSGDIYLSPAMSARMLQMLVEVPTSSTTSSVERLSDRELEVFRLIGQGLGTRQIAEQLNLSVKTIESHRAHIKDKLNLKTATELLQHATLWVQAEGGA